MPLSREAPIGGCNSSLSRRYFHCYMQKRFSIGNKLYLSVVSLFLIFAVSFVVFQQYREKQYKVDTLNLRLQAFNNELHDAMQISGKGIDEAFINSFLLSHNDRLGNRGTTNDLRVTIILRNGKVVFDNVHKNYESMANHASRPEVKEALARGNGSIVDRNSRTLNHDYFYSATYFSKEGYIIRSALPYNVDLARNLQTDQHYIWFSLAVMIILILVLYRFTHRLGSNITMLNDFAARADRSEKLDAEELIGFYNDELGDTAARIVKLYLKLQRTQQEQNVLKRQLTQNVAHELKTPVASIQGYLETIQENPRIDDKTRDLFLQRCYAQSKRLAALLNDMSMLNRMDDGADVITYEDVDVAELIRAIAKESQFNLEQKEMTMNYTVPQQILLHGNRSLLYSIFRNLTDNAIAYAGKGTHIELTAHWEAPYWCFVFSDNGIGVAPEHLPRLFERFYRVDKGRSRKMGGTGLGLAIVKNAVRVHGGSISVKNNPTGGLRFDFTLKP